MDFFGWGIVALLVLCMAIMGLDPILNLAHSVVMRWDMSSIQTAVVEYQGFRADGKAPSDLTILFEENCISQSESRDGRSHGKFLNKTGSWADGQITDPWGEPYTITLTDNDRHGTINCTGSGETVTKDF